MDNILVLSPYVRQYAYPSFWKLIDDLQRMEIVVDNPIEDISKKKNLKFLVTSKLKHIIPFISVLFSRLIYKKYKIIITFGTYQAPFIFFLKFFFPTAKFITYQPELFEFNGKISFLLFRTFIHKYDLFIDVDPIRLKLRSRIFNIPQSIVLPNFNHEVVKSCFTEGGKRELKFIYGGVVESENILIDFCTLFRLEKSNLDCFITKNISSKKFIVLKQFDPEPFSVIAKNMYTHGLICYPFKNGVKKDLNNKYCAPSKFFSYLAYGIVPIHYNHPTLKKYVNLGLSSSSPNNSTKLVNISLSAVEKIFSGNMVSVNLAFKKILGMCSNEY